MRSTLTRLFPTAAFIGLLADNGHAKNTRTFIRHFDAADLQGSFAGHEINNLDLAWLDNLSRFVSNPAAKSVANCDPFQRLLFA